MADHIAGYGLKVGSFVAPIWGGAGGGSAMGSADDRKQLPHPGAQGLRHRPADARDRHPPDRRHPHRLLDRRRGLGQGPGGQHQADRRDVPRGRQDRRRTTASSSSPRARSAGAACIPGARTSSCSRWSACPASSATRPTWRIRCSSPSATTPRRTGSCRRTTTGRTRPRSTPPTSKVADALRPWTLDFHVAQNDGTIFGSGDHEKTGRHCQRRRPERPARYRQARRLLAARRQGQPDQDDAPHLLGRLHVPERGDGSSRRPGTTILGAMIKVRDAHGWRE